MRDSRPNHLLIIYIYHEKFHDINKELIANEFNKVKQFRIANFGLYQFWAPVRFNSSIITA